MRRKTLARWLVVGAMAGLAVLGGAASSQAQPSGTSSESANNSNDADSQSGDASGSNTAGAAEVGAQQEHDDDEAIVQEGDNKAEVKQSGQARSGDSVAGSQVTGIVSGGNASVTQTNNSTDSRARSGDATVTNTLGSVVVGPRADGGAIFQEGDNDASISQSSLAITGDAVAGAQVTGIVTTDGGSASVWSDNTSEDARSRSGDANASNDIGSVIAGPATTVDIEDEEVPNGPAPLGQSRPLGDVAAVTPASHGGPHVRDPEGFLVQYGDNDVSVEQEAGSQTGDAVAGSQVTGLVTSESGSVNVNNRQSSEDATAESGESNSTNSLDTASAGPNLTIIDEGAVVVEGPVAPAQIVVPPAFAGVGLYQEGDNSTEVSQSSDVRTGDAVAGSQVTGAVGGGDVSITLANDSEDADATSGDATATNTAGTVSAGPVVNVVADVEFVDDIEIGGCGQGGCTVTVAVEGAGSIAQVGDNDVEFAQTSDATTGDAVAGAQVTGVVTTDGGSVTINASNVSEDSEATSGDAVATNDAGTVSAGPVINVAAIVGGPDVEINGCGGGDCHIIITAEGFGFIGQEGDNDLEFGQGASSTTGDAVAGGQVTGVVSSGDVNITLANDSTDDTATSGDAVATNTAATDGGFVSAGPVVNIAAVVGGDVTINGCGGGGCTITIDVTGEGTSLQEGDNDLDFGQAGIANSGDAVAGGQVTGVVADGGSVTINASNVSEDADATSGDAVVTNTAATDGGFVSAGPDINIAGVFGGDATINGCGGGDCHIIITAIGDGLAEQEGDNDLDFGQAGIANSGDAVAGGQVFGVLTSDPCTCSDADVNITASNVSEDAEATTGDATVDNTAATNGGFVSAGPDINLVAVGGDGGGAEINGCGGGGCTITITAMLDGESVQIGDNDLDFGQAGIANSGDAVAGGQVTGVVAEGDVTIMLSNDSTDDTATSGDATVANTAATDGGYVSAGPSISLDVALGDAVIPVGDEECPVGECDIILFASIIGATGQVGDNDLTFGQDGIASSGDAVAGGQVTGVVTSEGGDVTIVASNVSEDADARSGDALVTNTAATDGGFVSVGPEIAYVGGVVAPVPDFTIELLASLFQEGENELDLSQTGDVSSGDAVAGGQVTGVVASGTVNVSSDNTSEDDESRTGLGTLTNLLDFARVGPSVIELYID